MLTVSNSRSVGSDGIRPDIIKTNICNLAPQLTHIFNLSFSAGILSVVYAHERAIHERATHERASHECAP